MAAIAANDVSNDSPKAAEAGPAIVGEEAVAKLAEVRLESEPARHTEPKIESDLNKKTLARAHGETARPKVAGKSKRQAERAEEEASVDSNLKRKPQEGGESDSVEMEAEETMLESNEAVPVPIIATATKISKTTIYLSCTNVNSLQTFCEVKLQVCLSA